jgi:hypothetical protein
MKLNRDGELCPYQYLSYQPVSTGHGGNRPKSISLPGRFVCRVIDCSYASLMSWDAAPQPAAS